MKISLETIWRQEHLNFWRGHGINGCVPPQEPEDPIPDKWVGVISDTHGLLRPEALRLLAGCQQIIHAGDVGRPEILAALRHIAPVIAVRGNVDDGLWAEALPATQWVEVEGFRCHVLHNLEELEINPRAEGAAAVITGHTHRPERVQRGGVLFFNPGSAGPRRFRLPVTLGRLWVEDGELQARVFEMFPP